MLARISILLTVSFTATGVGMGQAPHSSVDSLVAAAARLSGCYQFTWQDSLPGLSLPLQLQLKSTIQRQLGEHKAGFFEVRPKQLRAGSYIVWRPLPGDSLEIDLMATPTPSLTDFSLSGVVARSTFAGVLLERTSEADSSHTRVVGRFTAVRGGRCR